MTVYFAGIGSRETPQLALDQMYHFAELAAARKWVLRSGGAPGADLMFEMGCDAANGPKEIFIPWRGFNGSKSRLYPPSAEASRLAAEIHPAYERLRHGPKALLSRNMHQILGGSLDIPVQCVVCWTTDGCQTFETYGRKTGGTGSAIALASINNIPVFNLRNPRRFDDLIDFFINYQE